MIGIRSTFLLSGAAIFVSFLGTTFLLREKPRPLKARTGRFSGLWAQVPDRRPVVAMLATGLLLTFALTSIEPIITVYVALFAPASEVTFVSGLAMSAGALGGVLSSARLGRLADHIGHWRIVVLSLAAAALLLVPQAFVVSAWQLVLLRFLMGAALGGLMPGMASVIRHNAPEAIAGSLLGWSVSAQYVGQVLGPLAGGFVGGQIGMRAVFLGTAVLMAAGALANFADRAGGAGQRAQPLFRLIFRGAAGIFLDCDNRCCDHSAPNHRRIEWTHGTPAPGRRPERFRSAMADASR